MFGSLLQNLLRGRVHLLAYQTQLLPQLLLLLTLLLADFLLFLLQRLVLLLLFFLLLLRNIQQLLHSTHLRAHHHPNGNASQHKSDEKI